MVRRDKSFEGNEPILYLVATPIGNLGELSPRALEIIKDTDFIAAEDTRNSGSLISKFGIKKPFISCREHNESEASEKIINLLKEGKKVCYMSDAGYPTISDPGAKLVQHCLDNDIKISVASGPSAAIDALCCSGLDSSHFYFHGFLSPKENERNQELRNLIERKETLIFYESPHRIQLTLISMAATLGDRKAVIARELTKTHEEFIRGTLAELALLPPETLIGEMVIIIEGNQKKKEIEDNEILLALRDELEFGRSGKESVSQVSKNMDVPKNRVYDLYIKAFKDEK